MRGGSATPADEVALPMEGTSTERRAPTAHAPVTAMMNLASLTVGTVQDRTATICDQSVPNSSWRPGLGQQG